MKLGFCCKWLNEMGSPDPSMNQKSTTITSLQKLPKSVQYQKIVDLTTYNCDVLKRQLTWIATLPIQMRLFRITSDFVPFYTHIDVQWLMQDPKFQSLLSTNLSGIRLFADANNIRLCSHPGQFTNLCSVTPDIVDRAIDDLEYHSLLATLMGYGDSFHSSGFAINVHVNTSQDPGLINFKSVFENRLSNTVQNLLTIENTEFAGSVTDIVNSNIGKTLPIVLDFHHHWVESEGDYISPNDPRILEIIESWRGIKPLAHASVSQEAILVNHPIDVLPNYKTLNLKSTKLRSHSDLFWNTAVNDFVIQHLSWADIEIEAKGKNIASQKLYEYYIKKGHK